MGCEVKLIVGCKGTTSKKVKRSETPEIDGDYLYYPYLKDKRGNFEYTDIDETYFMIYAEIDMCKLGDCNLAKLLTANKDPLKEIFWYGYDGNTRIHEDRYEDKPNEVSVSECIEALKLDVAQSDYRRFKWALALLESMQDVKEASVIWFGH